MLNVASLFVPQNFVSRNKLSFPPQFQGKQYSNYVKQALTVNIKIPALLKPVFTTGNASHRGREQPGAQSP